MRLSMPPFPPPWLKKMIRNSRAVRELGEDPEDIAQELYLALLERQSAAATAGRPSHGPREPGFLRFARHTMIDIFRRRDRRLRVESLTRPAPDPAADPERGAACRRAMRHVTQRAGAWRLPYRECMELRVNRGLSHREVARATKSSPSAVARRTRLCLDELALIVDQHL